MPRKLELELSWPEMAEHVADQIEKEIKPKWKRQHFIEWYMKRESVGHRFDWRMVYRIYKICEKLEQEGDSFTVIVGKEGSGKTTLALQMAAWTSPTTFKIDHICYNAEQYLKKVKELIEKRKADLDDSSERISVVLDEAALDLFSRKSMSKSNIDLSQVFFIQRILNIHVILCIPDFFGLDTIVREHRVATLITMLNKRGLYKGITGKGIQIIIKNYKRYGKNINSHPVPYGTFWQGTFNKPFPNTINTKEYLKNKILNVDDFVQKCLKGLDDTTKLMPLSKVYDQIGCSRRKLIGLVKSGDLDGKKIGDQWFITPESAKSLFRLDSPRNPT